MGWLMLAVGQRDWQPFPSVNEQTEKPGDDYKQGFSVKVYSKKLFDDAPLREFCSSGAGLLMFIQKLYNECEAEFGKGKVPAVSILKTPHMKFGKGTTRNVQYKIVKWVSLSSYRSQILSNHFRVGLFSSFGFRPMVSK